MCPDILECMVYIYRYHLSISIYTLPMRMRGYGCTFLLCMSVFCKYVSMNTPVETVLRQSVEGMRLCRSAYTSHSPRRPESSYVLGEAERAIEKRLGDF